MKTSPTGATTLRSALHGYWQIALRVLVVISALFAVGLQVFYATAETTEPPPASPDPASVSASQPAAATLPVPTSPTSLPPPVAATGLPTVIPTFPRTFQAQDIGVKLAAKPRVAAVSPLLLFNPLMVQPAAPSAPSRTSPGGDGSGVMRLGSTYPSALTGMMCAIAINPRAFSDLLTDDANATIQKALSKAWSRNMSRMGRVAPFRFGYYRLGSWLNGSATLADMRMNPDSPYLQPPLIKPYDGKPSNPRDLMRWVETTKGGGKETSGKSKGGPNP